MARRKIVFVIVEGASDETALGIHIVDTDAAYLADNKVLEDPECAELSYQDDGIHTCDVGKVVSRNKQKTDNLYRLRSCGNIWGVPYRVYYMSCNLDHVL